MKSFCVLNRSLSENTGKVIGSAVSCVMGKKIGILHSGDDVAQKAVSFLAAGVAQAGGSAILFGCCNESRVPFLVQHYALSACFFVNGKYYVSLYGADGKPVCADDEKRISELVSDGAVSADGGCVVEVNSDVSYLSAVVASCGNLEDVSASILCDDVVLSCAVNRAFSLSGGNVSPKPRFFVSRSGFCVSACDERGKVFTHDMLLNICAVHSIVAGQPLTVSFSAPQFLDEMASENNVVLGRAFAGGDELWQNDGIFLVARVLCLMAEKGEALSTLASAVPEYVCTRTNVVCSLEPDSFADMINCEEIVADTNHGFFARMKNGRAVITPCRNTGRYCVEVTALNGQAACEIAQELCLTINGA